jgi:DNA-binding transcriptional MerR regulator
MDDLFLTMSDLAKAAGVTDSCARRWVREGLVTPSARTEGGRPLFRPNDVQPFLKARAAELQRAKFPVAS